MNEARKVTRPSAGRRLLGGALILLGGLVLGAHLVLLIVHMRYGPVAVFVSSYAVAALVLTAWFLAGGVPIGFGAWLLRRAARRSRSMSCASIAALRSQGMIALASGSLLLRTDRGA